MSPVQISGIITFKLEVSNYMSEKSISKNFKMSDNSYNNHRYANEDYNVCPVCGSKGCSTKNHKREVCSICGSANHTTEEHRDAKLLKQSE